MSVLDGGELWLQSPISDCEKEGGQSRTLGFYGILSGTVVDGI
jgi:hypothetical protein